MKELKQNEFNQVIELFNQEGVHNTFAYSVIEGKQPGLIYTDDQNQPSCCLILSKSGKYLVVGDTENIDFNTFLSEYLLNKENHNHYFDIYSSSLKWVNKLDEILSDTAAKLSRQYYQYVGSKVLLNSLPEGYVLKQMDEDLFDQYVKEMDSSYKNLWVSSSNFMKHGFGFCILHDQHIVSCCNTYYVSDGFAEIDILTKEAYRKQGLALMTCHAFINHCFDHNMKPIWDCDNGNELSKALAVKLGFKSKDIYHMHWWHENKTFVQQYLNNYNYNE